MEVIRIAKLKICPVKWRQAGSNTELRKERKKERKKVKERNKEIKKVKEINKGINIGRK